MPRLEALARRGREPPGPGAVPSCPAGEEEELRASGGSRPQPRRRLRGAMAPSPKMAARPRTSPVVKAGGGGLSPRGVAESRRLPPPPVYLGFYLGSLSRFAVGLLVLSLREKGDMGEGRDTK